jgi:L-fucose isomerase-like protein
MSSVHDEKKVMESLKPLADFLMEDLGADFVEPGESRDFKLVWVMTGGVEGIFKKMYERLKKPVVILAADLNNSLAASLEILSYIRSRGDRGYIVHGGLEHVARDIERYRSFFEAAEKIRGARIGSIGGPSEWLIASGVDYEQASKRWGTSFVDIPMKEVYDAIKACEDSYDGYFDRATEVVEPVEKDIRGGHAIYLALRKIVRERKLDAVTLKCFDLLGTVKNTGCLALSRLNDEGVAAGCEGDLPSTFTMYLVSALTGKKAFMANPSKIDSDKNTVIFAHCTVPTTLVRSYRLRSHFESGIGTGIAGAFEEGDITVLKVGGKNLDRFFVSRGRIISNPVNEQRCRTQIEVKMEQDVRQLLKDPIGNHQVIVKGDIEKDFRDLLEYMGF